MPSRRTRCYSISARWLMGCIQLGVFVSVASIHVLSTHAQEKGGSVLERAELRIPAFTAYVLPNPQGARIREPQGITLWKDPSQRVVWYGQFAKTGPMQVCVAIEPKGGSVPSLKMRVAGQSRSGESGPIENGISIVNFGTWELSETGYVPLELERDSEGSEPDFRVVDLRLAGGAVEGAHFNLKERRNAASVHLMYPITSGTEIEAFYGEVTAVEDPIGTFYMTCGWHRGYFGMQVNSPNERRIIFSVWDSGNEGIDRNKVASENRVQLIDKGKDVFSGDFGNEGTGGHSHLKTMWETGSTQRFLVTATPVDATHTIFAGYWFNPIDERWMLISAWNAPKEGGRLRGLHSFSENFIGENGHLQRKALYGNSWYRTSDGVWHEIIQARFSHDPTGKEDRFDRFMGIEKNQFFLSHGGFVPGFTKYGESFEREPVGKPPNDLDLPSLPVEKADAK